MFKSKESKKWCGEILVVLMCVAVASVACAARLEQDKLLASDGATSDWFGRSVSINGNYCIVGAANNDDNGNDSGSAYIFKYDGENWTEQAKLLASDAAPDDRFGYSVAISGDYCIVGATQDDDNGTNTGSAYIFIRSGETWTEQDKLTASDANDDDKFGYSVSIDGSYAIIGACGDDDNGSNAGSAYIFKRDGTTWTEQAKLLASDGATNDSFGGSVSIKADYCIVGAKNGNSFLGSAYIFKRDGTTWPEQDILLASDGASTDSFGCSVSIDGSYCIVGANNNDENGSNSGSAYIFKRDDTTWSQQAKLLASDGASTDYFGYSVSISGDYAIMGAYGDDDNGSMSGSAYIFKRDDTSWSQQAQLLASDGADQDLFGSSVSISGDYCLIGAFSDNDDGSSSGSAYVFKTTCPTADLSNDCFVNFEDFEIMAGQWLQD